MVTKVYISDTNTATIVCPQCDKNKTVDVSRYVALDQTVRVKSKCSCGHTWTSVLEKRRQYRKSVDFPGLYELVQNRRIPHIRIDGRILFKEDLLQDWIAEQIVEAVGI